MQDEILEGYCHCGCGRKTPICTATKTKYGYVKGKPQKFCQGHRPAKLSINRFWSRVNKTESCWLWTGYSVGNGYGMARMDNRRVLAHRISWQLAYGPIPDTMLVLHKCDVPACVNPYHLFIGTQKDNVQDCKQKGRLNRKVPIGERHGRSKLSNIEVLAIRKLGTSVPVQQTAQRFNVANDTVRSILNRKSWRHLDDNF